MFAQNKIDPNYSTIYVMRTGKWSGSEYSCSIFLANQAPFNISSGDVVAFKVFSEGEVSVAAQYNRGAGNYFCTVNVKRGNEYFLCLTAGKFKEESKEYVQTFIRKRENKIQYREENKETPINASSLKDFKGEKSQATCFLISTQGYLITNYHCVEQANEITIKGIGGDFSIKYQANLVASDRANDLALLKLNSKNLKFDSLPFSIRTSGVPVAEKIFALGYPKVEAMGQELKVTEGIISAKSGAQGDASKYQVSAPVNPGNSGGPLIDETGNLVGIISAKSSVAESAGYAIKASYLEAFLKSVDELTYPPFNNTVQARSLPEKVKLWTSFIFIVEGN